MYRKPLVLLKFTYKHRNRIAPHVTGSKTALELFYEWMLYRDIPCRLYKYRVDIPIDVWNDNDDLIRYGLDTINGVCRNVFNGGK